MMAPAPISPQAVQLAHSRAALLERKRWLAPNSRRGRELAAEIRRLAVEELKLEVREPESQKSGNPEREQRAEEIVRQPRLWWVEGDR